jgi:hypothetical protein
MQKSLLLIIGLLFSITSVAQSVAIGQVVDQQENAIHNVRIQEKGTRNIVFSNSTGEFSLSFFDTETPIVFSHPDFDTVTLKIKPNVKTLVFLSPKANTNTYNLGFLAGFTDFTYKNTNKNLQNMPYFLGESDVNRQLQMLPGIEQGREGYSNLFVRGGEADQNLTLYNGTPIYNSNHIFGISSTFHHRSIKNTSVYKGIAPAKFGGRASSYIELESEKNSKYSGLSGEFEMTPLNAGIYIANIEKDHKYFTIAARRSWIDLLVPVESRENSLNANIYDLQINLGKTLKNSNKLDVSFMSTRDLYFIGFAETDTLGNASTLAGFTQKWSNILASAKYSMKVSSALSLENLVYYSGYRTSTKLQQESIKTRASGSNKLPTTTQEDITGIQDIGLQINAKYLYRNQHHLSFGIQSSTKLFQVGKREFSSIDFPDMPNVFRTTGSENYEVAQEIALYAEDHLRLNENAILDLGVRQVFFFNDNSVRAGFEPRLHATFFLENRDVFKIGLNRHHQYVSQLNLGSIGNPANIWVPATQLIEPQILDIVEVAYERKLGKEFAGSINGYFKRLQNLNLVNNLSDASDPSIDWQSSVTQGVGQVFGAEVMLQRTKGMFNGWMSYTYSKSTRNFESLFASDFDFTYDRPHMFKMHVNYTNEDAFWNFGVNIVVGSGQLFTLPIGKFLDSNDEIQLQYNTLNNYRSPLYTRLDLSLVRLKSNFGLDQEWRFYLYNALGSRNPLNIAANFEGNSNFNVLQVNRAYLAYVPGVAYIVKF